MANKRKVNVSVSPGGTARSLPHNGGSLNPLSIALGVLAGTVVYVFYFPSDSVAVEKGDGLWFCFLAITIATLTIGGSLLGWAGKPPVGDNAAETIDEPGEIGSSVPASIASRRSRDVMSGNILDAVLWTAPWLLAAWMMLAARATSPPGNLRMATNEAWLWVAAAAVFTAARCLLADLDRRRAMLLLITACICGLAVHGLHQQFISLPQTRADYWSDPDKMLAEAGFDAPAGSAERMMFENRLRDGGPTGTFALANSLAAVLLVGAIVCLGMLRLRWSALSATARVSWVFATVLCIACLLATRSRSGALALMVGTVLVLIAASRIRRTRRRQAMLGLAVVLAVGVAAAIGLAILGNPQWGNPEWLEAAPASVAFRFQYWRSTLAMVLDRPLFGAGPGNFQSIYERYREPSATEQIAEPHNFLFETSASGGFVALAMLICLILAGLAIYWKGGRDSGQDVCIEPPVAPSDAPAGKSDGDAKWVALGAGLGLAMVWLIGLATRQLPDVDAHAIAVPVSLVLATLLWPSMQRLPEVDLDLIGSVALIALMMHLLAAGGWTVPGVAMIAWLLFAALTRTSESGFSASGSEGHVAARDPGAARNHSPSARSWRSPKHFRAAGGLVIIGGTVAAAAIYFLSIRPTELGSRAMSQSAYLQSTGQIGRARAAIERAVDADQWSPEAAIWLADYHRWQLILERDDSSLRSEWERAIALVKLRAGDDPAIYRILGAQQLHLFQRYGQPRDLRAAAETFTKAGSWSPANEWIMAQSAAIAAAQGRPAEARQLAARALELSLLGGNIERSLDRQQIYAVSRLGALVRTGPIRRPASELLANQIGADNVPPQ